MSLLEQLNRIETSISNIQSYEFSKPGIFTNAIVNRPPITTLLKDPSTDERNLYTVTTPKIGNQLPNEVEIERVDGRKRYIEHDTIEDSFLYDASTASASQFEDYDLPVARIPTLLPPNSETQSKLLLDLDQQLNSKSCAEKVEHLLSVANKYPNLIENARETRNKLVLYLRNVNELENEIAVLENEIDECKVRLRNEHNVATSPVKRRFIREQILQPRVSEKVVDIEELIAKEEEEIQLLEQEVNDKLKH